MDSIYTNIIAIIITDVNEYLNLWYIKSLKITILKRQYIV